MLFFVLFLLLKYSIRSSLESYVENLPYMVFVSGLIMGRNLSFFFFVFVSFLSL